jgi:hypothetical protein
MWTIAQYEPVALLSLKLSTATSTGGKALLLPTPFAIKMALLDVVIRTEGLAEGERQWPAIRDGQVAIDGPAWIVANNTFTKILKPPKEKPSANPETGLIAMMIRTIAFREYVQWQGKFRLAFAPGSSPSAEAWARRLTLVNYIGKRGGFVQATGEVGFEHELDSSFVRLNEESDQFPLAGTPQLLDDCTSAVTFQQVNIYSEDKLRMGKERILRQIVVPYRLERASRGYSVYKRL